MTQLASLADVANVLAGYAFPSALYTSDGEGTGLLRGINVSPNAIDWSDRACWKRKEEDGLERYELAEGDIVVGMDRPWISSGFRAAVVEHCDLPALLVQRVARVRANPGVEQRYLAQLLRTPGFERHLKARHTETTVPHISHRDIETFRFSLPLLPEQRRIADLLDKADSIRLKRQKAITLTKELLRSAFLEMFGDPVTNPKGWEVKPVTDLCASKQYGTAEKANTERLGIPVLRMNNLTYSGEVDLAELKWVSLSGVNASKLDLRDGDVLFNRVNSHELVGKTAVWHHGDGYTFAGYLIRLRLRARAATGDYVSAAMNMPSMKRVLKSMAKPSINMANISGSDLSRVLLPIPPLAHQRRYGALRQSVDALRAAYRRADLEGNALCGALRQRAFRGDLMPRRAGATQVTFQNEGRPS